MTTLACDVSRGGTPLDPYWRRCVGAGHAALNLRADFQDHLRMAVRDCGFEALRFHGLFHDDMHVYAEDSSGAPVLNWQTMDALFDALLAAGVRPFVELGFCPSRLAIETGTVFWWKGHGSPPKDYGKWAAMVRGLAEHLVARYGLDEVRRWRFEVWNEPNLAPFWRGTRSRYFQLYRASAEILKGVDADLKVGGPATSNFVPDARFAGETEDQACVDPSYRARPEAFAWRGVWIEEFLEFCAKEGLPVDFLSTHPYPTDFALDEKGESVGMGRGRDSVLEDLAWIRRTLDASAFAGAEIHLTEWSSSPSSRDHHHDFPPAACYVARSYLKGAGLCDSLSYWTLSDVFEENAAGPTAWHGGFGLVNLQGIPKPTYWAFALLNRLGRILVAQDEGWAVTRRDDGGAAALLYHYPDAYPMTPALARSPEAAREVLETGSPRRVRLDLSGLAPNSALAVHTLDAGHGWARGVWESMGSPEPPTREQVREIKEAARPAVTAAQADAQGRLQMDLALAPWAVALVETA